MWPKQQTIANGWIVTNDLILDIKNVPPSSVLLTPRGQTGFCLKQVNYRWVCLDILSGDFWHSKQSWHIPTERKRFEIILSINYLSRRWEKSISHMELGGLRLLT